MGSNGINSYPSCMKFSMLNIQYPLYVMELPPLQYWGI